MLTSYVWAHSQPQWRTCRSSEATTQAPPPIHPPISRQSQQTDTHRHTQPCQTELSVGAQGKRDGAQRGAGGRGEFMFRSATESGESGECLVKEKGNKRMRQCVHAGHGGVKGVAGAAERGLRLDKFIEKRNETKNSLAKRRR